MTKRLFRNALALIVLAAIIAACAEPAIPSAQDFPDDEEAPPNTTDPLGNPINPDPPPTVPETPPAGNPAPNATVWSLFPADVKGLCLTPVVLLRNLVFRDDGSTPGGSWSFSTSLGILQFNLTAIGYQFVLSIPNAGANSGTIISWSSTQPELSCAGTGGTWERARRYAGP